MEQSFSEFRQSVINPKGKPKKFKITNSIGAYDIYKMMRKAGWLDIGRPVKEKEYYAIIRGVNDCLAKEIALGKTIQFPAKMGKLELRKQERGVSIVDGKLKITYPINWNETLKLWYEDPEAMRNKTLLRCENKYLYRVRYDVFDATYENKLFYQFKLNTFIQDALSKNIREGKVDTAWCTNMKK